MKKIILLITVFMPALMQAQVVKQLKKTIELQMPKTKEDDMPGTRGASVVWHPVQKKYYAAFAGNEGYPLAVFDATGKRLSNDETTTMVDVRGLWYNEKNKKICGNGFNEIGWFEYTLDSKGIPESIEVYKEGLNQPGEQSVGAYNAKNEMLYFISANKIEVYNADGMWEEDSSITIYIGFSKKPEAADDEPEPGEDYNNTTVVYTGIAKTEFGLLNTIEKQVELYNRKTGLMTQKLKLPADATTELSFNFSYANGTYWLFDMENRKWVGNK